MLLCVAFSITQNNSLCIFNVNKLYYLLTYILTCLLTYRYCICYDPLLLLIFVCLFVCLTYVNIIMFWRSLIGANRDI